MTNHDVAVEHPMSTSVQYTLIQLVAGAVGCDVIDEDRIVVELITLRQVNTIEADLGADAVQKHPHLMPGDAAAEHDRAGGEATAPSLLHV